MYVLCASELPAEPVGAYRYRTVIAGLSTAITELRTEIAELQSSMNASRQVWEEVRKGT